MLLLWSCTIVVDVIPARRIVFVFGSALQTTLRKKMKVCTLFVQFFVILQKHIAPRVFEGTVDGGDGEVTDPHVSRRLARPPRRTGRFYWWLVHTWSNSARIAFFISENAIHDSALSRHRSKMTSGIRNCSRWQVKNEVGAPPTLFHFSGANGGEEVAPSPAFANGKY